MLGLNTYSRIGFIALSLSWGGLARATDADEVDARLAREAIIRGDDAFKAGNFDAAHKAFADAWNHKKSFSSACKLGRMESLQGTDAALAAAHISYCLEHFTDTGEEVALEPRFRTILKELRTRVVSVHLSVDPKGAEIWVDNAPAEDRALGQELFLLPGTHQVEARLPGHRSIAAKVLGEAGSERSLTFVLEPIATAAPVPGPTPGGGTALGTGADGTRFQAHSSQHPPLAILIGGGLLTAAALGFGLGFTARAEAKYNSGNDLRAQLGPALNACSEGSGTLCENLRDTEASRRHAAQGAIGSYIASAVFGAATAATWFLWPSPRKEATSPNVGRLQVRGYLLPSGTGASTAGLTLSGTL